MSNNLGTIVTKINQGFLLSVILIAAGCTTTQVDEVRSGYTGLGQGESVVVLGRRHKSDYETEVDFIACVGKALQGRKGGFNIVPEQEFADSLYPWFEPRTAPVRMAGLQNMLKRDDVAARITAMGGALHRLD